MTFEAWKIEVDKLLIKVCGLASDDLADAPYWDNWDAGLEPAEMVDIVLEYNDFI